ncbi:proteasome activator complex subunit 3-like [Drosophila miranda]|uniref:proteasome activator complex subunit 3-like n=1 Tax=Drosophila miranda TaxID=7229 RepID=UPI0007E6CADC|nr:proteasome activator complex subunit 3-like [Drosophila miranda]
MSSMSEMAITYPKVLVTKLGTQLLAGKLGFPQKIVELNELLNSPMFKEVEREQGTPVEVEGQGDGGSHDEGQEKCSCPVPCTKAVWVIVEAAKPFVKAMVANANVIKMWVAYMVEKSVNSNSLAASILDDVQKGIGKIYSEANGSFKQISKYHAVRARRASDVAGYPGVEECREDIFEILCEVRKVYSMLIDFADKDWNKLKDYDNALDTL